MKKKDRKVKGYDLNAGKLKPEDFSEEKMREVFTELFKDSYPRQIAPGVWQLSKGVTTGDAGMESFTKALTEQINEEISNYKRKNTPEEGDQSAEEE